MALYLVSAEAGAGKTTIGAGVGRHLLDDGRKVGFLKPVIGEKRSEEDSDAAFMKQILSLPEPVNALSPLIQGERALADRIREAYIEVSQRKDVVIIEGMTGRSPDDALSKSSHEIAEALKARIIFVEAYSGQGVAGLIDGYRGFGPDLLGIVLNKVPVSQLKRVAGEVKSHFEGMGIAVLGVVPEDRVLLTLTIGELANSIQGEILNNAEKSAELVENFMVGAMYVDSGLEYFGRKKNKAAVVRDDRPDMQMAALETSTRCLVISGEKGPTDYVRHKAAEKGIPVVLARNGTDTIVKNVGEALGRARFGQAKKLSRLAEITGQHLSFQAIQEGLGLG